MKLLNNTAEIDESYNCRSKNNCPLDGKCLTQNIIYESQITSNQLSYKQKIYTGTAETGFKQKFDNHTKSFNLAMKTTQNYLKKAGQLNATISHQCISMKSLKLLHKVTKGHNAVFPMEPPFWPTQSMFCINKNCAAQNDSFIGEYSGEYFL